MMEGGTPRRTGSAWSQQEPGLTHGSKRKQGGRFFSELCGLKRMKEALY